MIGDDDDVASPCVSVCKMAEMSGSHPDALCAGCLRTIEEIANWGGASAAQKRAIWHEITKRRAKLKGRIR
jgi:predicted Fe-S protein YdhL (DUF1289 family)